MSLQDEARSYLDRDWSPIPLHHPVEDAWGIRCSCRKGYACTAVGKHPRIAWRGLGHVTRAQVDEWWGEWPDANVGLLTGARSGGLVLLDIDPKNGGTLDFFVNGHPRTPRLTPRIQTGSGGWHEYYHSAASIPNSVSKLAPGVDVRGDGGLIVAPPSMHQSGNRYQPIIGFDVLIAELPDEYGESLTRKIPDSGRIDPHRHSGSESLVLPNSGIAPLPAMGQWWLRWALDRVAEGKRNDIGLKLACQLRDNGLGLEEAQLVMLAYADAVATLGNHLYLPQQALDTLLAVDKRPSRNPTTIVSLPLTTLRGYTIPRKTYASSPDRDRLAGLAKRADAMRSKGKKAFTGGRPADVKLTAQHEAFTAAWDYICGCPLQPGDMRRWFSWLGKDPHKAERLTGFLFALADASNPTITSPRAYFESSLARALGREYKPKKGGQAPQPQCP